MQCSIETLAWLFYNVSSSSFLLLFFLYFSSTLLVNVLNFIGSYPLLQRNQNGYEYVFSDEEEDVEDHDSANYYADCTDQKDHFVADTNHACESFVFLSDTRILRNQTHAPEEFCIASESVGGNENFACDETERLSTRASAGSESEHGADDEEDMEVEEIQIPITDAESVMDHGGPTSPIITSDRNYGEDCIMQEAGKKKVETNNFSADEKFLIFAPTQLESRKLQAQEKDDEEEIFGDSCTVGSTSKSSSEWRSSIKDSGTEDPFSSSSRRSCPKWESYTMFQKYDEEMMFLDRISAQKLHETESLKSIQVNPRSISDRIVHKFTTINKTPSNIAHNPFHELEAAYVAQICLTWEALNWNYRNFHRKRASRHDFDPGCPADVAQQFQQFQVLLQRYVENEPYEQGRRPEVYARMRLLAPKLLLVPEYRDPEDDQKDEGFGSRISSGAFLMIMEDGIRTFMHFLKADKEKPCHKILKAFFKRNRRGSVDPVLLNLMKKVNIKKKMKLKDLRRSHRCIRKRKLKVEEEMEILMGLIDLKVVSRVLRMTDLSEEQLHWCEEKMSKVRVSDGKLQRDSAPLFFPAH